MKIVWDEPKRRSNLATHGFDLADAEAFDWEDAVILSGYRGPDRRSRFKAVGWLGERFITIVFAELGTGNFDHQHARRQPQGEKAI